jgi:MraZ protein
MSLFLSTFVNKIDRKGRISIPSSFRTALETTPSFQGVILFRSYTLPAIEGCAINRMQLISDSIDRLELFSEGQEDLASTIFADSHQLAWDSEGRIMLPKTIQEYAEIRESATFVGRGATFQIWNPEKFEAYQHQARARIKERGATLTLSRTPALVEVS